MRVPPGLLRRGALIALGLCLLFTATGFSLQEAPDGTPGPVAPQPETRQAQPPRPVPFAASAIADQAVATGTLLRNASAALDTDAELQAISAEYAAEKDRLDALQDETVRRIKGGGPASVLAGPLREWRRAAARLDDWQQALTARAATVGSLRQEIVAERARWELTRDGAAAADLPPELVQTIGDTLTSIGGIEERLASHDDRLLSLQAAIGRQKGTADTMVADLSREIARRRVALFQIDSPPIWQAFTASVEQARATGQAAPAWQARYVETRRYVTDNRARFVRQLVLFTLAVAALVALRRRSRAWSAPDSSIVPILGLLERPAAVAVVALVPLARLAHPNTPSALDGVGTLAILVATLRLLSLLLQPAQRRWVRVLAAPLFVWPLVFVTPTESFLNRLALLLLSLLGALAAAWISRYVSREAAGLSAARSDVASLAARLAATLLVVAALANVAGAVGLATFITDGTLVAIFAGLVLTLLTLMLQGMVRICMLSETLRQTHLVRVHAQTVQQTFSRAIAWVLFIAWIYTALRGFLLADPVLTSLAAFLETEGSIGQFAISPADILIFIVVVWVSYKLSQLIRFVLDADVFPHTHLPRGSSAAIMTLTHYAVMTIGVLVAFSAAGFDLSRITIIFGALGVGIGFGLQNVVNNFVCGLILLFERPVKVGDVIELDDLMGEVREIAMRASRIRAFDGARIVVPNSDLLSARVVNWTYRDNLRRVEIPVGVAYGTDPARVIDLLANVASKHPEVSDVPEPKVLFLALGDSALDFVLRFWAPTTTYKRVSSEVLLGVTEALNEAEINIPFPQRDLHLRSIPEGFAPQDTPGASGS